MIIIVVGDGFPIPSKPPLCKGRWAAGRRLGGIVLTKSNQISVLLFKIRIFFYPLSQKSQIFASSPCAQGEPWVLPHQKVFRQAHTGIPQFAARPCCYKEYFNYVVPWLGMPSLLRVIPRSRLISGDVGIRNPFAAKGGAMRSIAKKTDCHTSVRAGSQ